MKKTLLVTFGLLIFLSTAHATLITIGTAAYDHSKNGTIEANEYYNLIWDDDNNGKSLVWLDYKRSKGSWYSYRSWVSNLGSQLTVNLNPGYTSNIDWTVGWRLPITMDGYYEYRGVGHGYDGSSVGGYNITTSEMGHLYYEELGNLGYFDTEGYRREPGDFGLQNTGVFENLIEHFYWSNESQNSAWLLRMNSGLQVPESKTGMYYGLAVRSGQVSVVPEPTTMFLFGLGILGVAGVSRRKK
jgi:hypothetical protein